MQFKYPELLWALLLLLIPIFIHLFQLRRFKKTPFTNVKFLKKVVSESRRSNTLKKWLLLLTRLLLLAAMVIAFAQPFFAEKSALKEKETVIYLDESFSMQAKADGAGLLDNAVQELIKSVPKETIFTLFTNDKVYRNVTIVDIQNDLLALPYTANQLKLDDILLKANAFFSSDATKEKNFIMLSDFQQQMAATVPDTTNNVKVYAVQLFPDEINNISLDSVYLNSNTTENINLTAIISSNGSIDGTPVSLYNGDRLIAKTAAVFNSGRNTLVNFTLPKNEITNGKLEISESGLTYDNQFYFNIGAKDKIKVLVVGNEEADFLKRIYTEDEFQWSRFPLNNLNYNDLPGQNLIILYQLETIPTALSANLKSFTDNGGTLVVVPAMNTDLASYNRLLANYYAASLNQRIDAEHSISTIAFTHPLYQNVFAKKVANFQFPKVSQYFRIKALAPALLSFENMHPFLVGADAFFLFTAPISLANSNFRNSPLIVPTFYNMGLNSLKMPELYSTLGKTTRIEVPISLQKDHILKVSKGSYEFIPQQQSMANKVILTIEGNLDGDGIYNVKEGENVLKSLSFNLPRNESELRYLRPDQLPANATAPSISTLFQTIEKDNSITELWKWFVILASLLLLVEILLQKYFT